MAQKPCQMLEWCPVRIGQIKTLGFEICILFLTSANLKFKIDHSRLAYFFTRHCSVSQPLCGQEHFRLLLENFLN